MSGRMIVAGLAAVVALGCGGSSGTPAGPNPTGDITVGNNFFNPSSFSVASGSTVTWAWSSSGIQHNVTFDDAGPSSPTQGSGDFQRTFTIPGTYPYHCTIHGAAVMSGTITVTAAGTGTGTGTGTGGGAGGGGTNGGGYGVM